MAFLASEPTAPSLLRVVRRAGDQQSEAWARQLLGVIHALAGHHVAARVELLHVAGLFARLGLRAGEAMSLRALAFAAAVRGDADAAAVLTGAAEAASQRYGVFGLEPEHGIGLAALETVRAATDAARWAAAQPMSRGWRCRWVWHGRSPPRRGRVLRKRRRERLPPSSFLPAVPRAARMRAYARCASAFAAEPAPGQSRHQRWKRSSCASTNRLWLALSVSLGSTGCAYASSPRNVARYL